MNKGNLEFYPLVHKLELILGTPTKAMGLIGLIGKKEFIHIRESIILAFEIDFKKPFTGEFGVEVEHGDISDAVRLATVSLYPQSTEMNKLISPVEREAWCSKIINSLDGFVQYQ